MSIEALTDELDEIFEKAWVLPLSGGRSVIDTERAKEIVEDIRLKLPNEIQQAKAVVADRNQIIANAKKEAEATIRVAEERARAMVNESEIVKESQIKANEIIEKAKSKYREMCKAANDYVDDLMKRADDSLTENLSELRKTRKSLKESKR